MNQINPKKLLNSKWSAVAPKNKEKHFIVTKMTYSEDDGSVTGCWLEAVFTQRVETIDWQILKDSDNWLLGWQ